MHLKMRIQQKVGRYRDRMRAAGFRPVQIWVPDTRRAGFAEECRRQSALLHQDPQEREVLDWIESVSDVEGWH